VSSVSADIQRRYWENNQLHGLILELTHRCPCRCKHCYVVHSPQADGLTTAEVLDLLDQAREEGVFHLTLTGGEVMLRKDIFTIIEKARQDGHKVTLLTSGLTLDDDQADKLATLGIFSVELSVLGASAAVNDDLMQVPGALERICRAARMLRERGVPVVLKATVMRPNAGELQAMDDLARELDCQFNASPSVVACRNGDTDPLELALSNEELAELDQSLLNGGLIPGEDSSQGATLICKAGRTVAGISPKGDVYPCIMWPRSIGNIRERRLKDIWHTNPDEFLVAIRELEDKDISGCLECDIQRYCKRCPGMAWQENQTFAGPASTICAAAQGYAQGIKNSRK